MKLNYASIIHAQYRALVNKDMKASVDLAFFVVDTLLEISFLPDPWSLVLKRAQGLIKTTSRRSKVQFLLSVSKAIEDSDLSPLEPCAPAPTIDNSPNEREDIFQHRIRYPRVFIKDIHSVRSPRIERTPSNTTIKEEYLPRKGREDEFKHRIENPRTFRRGD